MADKQAEREEKRKKIQALVNKINQDAKSTVMGEAAQMRNALFLRRPTGILQLDRDLGGGLPGGSIVAVSGMDGSGKSYLSQKICAMNQRLYGEDSSIYYCPTEHSFDHMHARKIGFKVSVPDAEIELRNRQRKQLGLPPFTKEEIRELKTQVGNVQLGYGRYAEELLDSVLAAAESNLYQVIVIDSVSALEPKSAAVKESIEDNSAQGGQATALKKFFLKYMPILRKFNEDPNATTLICTQQMVANRKKAEASPFMQKFLPDSVPAMGSHSMKHAKLVDILLKSLEIEKKEDAEGLKQAKHKTLRWETGKGKAGSHEGITGEVEFDFKSHVDTFRTIYNEGVRMGLITESGKKSSVKGIEQLTKVTYKEFVDVLLADVELEKKLRLTILHEQGIDCSYG